MSRTTIAFYAIGAVLFGMLSVMWFRDGSTGWGIFAAAVALWDVLRAGMGIGAQSKCGGEEAAPAAPFGVPGPDSVTVEIRVAGGSRLEAIRALREAVPGLGLKDGKDVVDAALEGGTAVLTRAATPEQAARIREALAASGAGVEIVLKDGQGR